MGLAVEFPRDKGLFIVNADGLNTTVIDLDHIDDSENVRPAVWRYVEEELAKENPDG